MGKNHLRILGSLDGVELVGIADPLARVGIASDISGHETFTEFRDLLDRGLDYCVIAAPTGFHREISVEALSRGVNCLIEKPVAVNYEEALEIQTYMYNQYIKAYIFKIPGQCGSSHFHVQLG